MDHNRYSHSFPARGKSRVLCVPLEIMADIKVEVAVVVEVGPCGGSWPVAVAGESCGRGRVFEASAAPVVEKGVRAPAGDEEVGAAVVIIVADGNAVAVTAGERGQTGLLGHVVEVSVAAVAEEPVAEWSRPGRRGKFPPLNGKDVEPAITVEIEEGDASAHGLGELELSGVPIVKPENEACAPGIHRQTWVGPVGEV